MLTNTVRLSLLLALVLQLGCEQPPMENDPTAGSRPTPAPAEAVDHGTPVADAEDDYKTWSLGEQVEFSAWASGDNRVGETTYLWGNLVNNNDYVEGDISFEITTPDGSKTESMPLEKQELESAGDPNYGNTFTPKQAGRHRVSFRVTPNGQQEQQLGGLVFDVE